MYDVIRVEWIDNYDTKPTKKKKTLITHVKHIYNAANR